MSLQSIRDALDTRLQTLSLITSNAYDVAWEGVLYTPQPDRPYLAVQLAGISRRAIAAGEKAAIQWDGTFQVTVMRPLGEGTDPVTAAVDLILALFPRGLSLTATDGAVLRFDVPTPQALMQDGNAWIRGPVRMPFFVHELPT